MTDTCGKCDGKGKLDWARHIEAGTCFDCGGSGRINVGRISSAEATRDASNRAANKAYAALRRAYPHLRNVILNPEISLASMYPHAPGAALWAEAGSILFEAVKAGAIRPSQVARLEEIGRAVGAL